MNSERFKILLAFALAISSCSGPIQDAVPSVDCVRLNTPGADATKVAMDARGDAAVLPVFWSAGDMVCVNGIKSAPLEIPAESTSADFYVNNVQSPYSVFYPAESVTSYVNGCYTVSLPGIQEYVEKSADTDCICLVGSTESDEPVQMRHLSAVVKFVLAGPANTVIKDFSVTSLSGAAPISGLFSADPALEYLDYLSDGDTEVQLVLPEDGVKLGNDKSFFFVSIPAGIYPEGFVFKITDSNGKIQKRYWLREAQGSDAGLDIKPGTVINLNAGDFVPDASEICSADDWSRFVEAYTEGTWEEEWKHKDGAVHIGADFVAECLDMIPGFSDVLDGGGHTITLTQGNGPLVGTLSGTVKNLKVGGLIKAENPDCVSAFCGRMISGALLSDCTNEAQISFVSSGISDRMIAAPFVGVMEGGRVADCVNEGVLAVDLQIADASEIYVGGIAALVSVADAKVDIDGCENSGAVSVVLDRTARYSLGVGGVAGKVVGGGKDKYLTISNSSNSADVSASVRNDATHTFKNASGVGGILGVCAKLDLKSDGYRIAGSVDGYHVVLSSCVNTGRAYNGLTSFTASNEIDDVCVGGLAGILLGSSADPALLQDCTCTGQVIPYEGASYNRTTYSTVAGGLCGIGGYVNADKCTVNCAKIGTLARQSYSVSAGIGLALRTFCLQESRFFANICIIRVKNFTEKSHSLGFTLTTASPSGSVSSSYINLAGSSVSGCYFGGVLSTNKDLVTNGAQLSNYGTIIDEQVTEDNFRLWIASGNYGGSDVSITNNVYWDGK